MSDKYGRHKIMFSFLYLNCELRGLECIPPHVNVIFLIFSGPVISSYGREYAADPYLGHSIGPVAGYGVSTTANCFISFFSRGRSTSQDFLTKNSSQTDILYMEAICWEFLL